MIYIAAEFKLAEVAGALASRLASAGIEVTSDWHAKPSSELSRRLFGAELQAAGRTAAKDIRRSKTVVVFLAHRSREVVAVGAFAIGVGIPVIFVGYPNNETMLLDQENVWWVDFLGDAFDMIKKQFCDPDGTDPDGP